MAKQKFDKTERISRKEKIENVFLLQFTYIMFAAMLLLFIYNGRLNRYGAGFANVLPPILWTLTAVSAVLTAVFFVLYAKNKENKNKTLGIYSAITVGFFLWCVGFEKFFRLVKFTYLANVRNLLQLLFIVLGVALVVCIAIYVYKINTLNKSLKKKR